jgi:hypothetical protein
MSDFVSDAPAADALAVVAGSLAGTQAMAAEQVKSDVQREQPNLSEAAKARVKFLNSEVKLNLAHWSKRFKKMKHDMKFARGKNQYRDQREDDERYICNFVQRHIRQRVAKIYAKNPTAVVKRKERLKYALWDGKSESLMMAQQTMQAAAPAPGQPPAEVDPVAMASAGAIIEDITTAMTEDQMLDRIGQTGKVMFHYFMNEQEPSFKDGMKRVVRRAKTCGVGYVRMGFKRVMGKDPKDEQGLIDSQRKLERLKALRADLQDQELTQADQEIAELEESTKALLAKREIILREGLEWDFPNPTRVIPDRKTKQLKGWIGTDLLTLEIPVTIDRVKEVYQIDLKNMSPAASESQPGNISDPYSHIKGGSGDSTKKGSDEVKVWLTYCRSTGLMYTHTEGYEGYLTEPEAPVFLERFFPIYAYAPNELEDDCDDPFPDSDVELLKHSQREYNRIKDALRVHRIANRPGYVAPKGAIPKGDTSEEDDAKKFAEHLPHEIMELNSLGQGQKITDIFAPIPKVPIDPSLYETEGVFQDAQRSVGSDDNEFGATGDATATESAIAENERLTSVSDDIQELDSLLSEIARDAFKIMACEVSEETAKRIAGRGAMWPQMSKQEIAEELFMDVVAGSSGKPNAAQEVAKLKEVIPLAVQIPGMNPKFWAERLVRAVDPAADLAEAYTEGLQSMVTMNRAAQASVAGAADDPAAQGPAGADKAPRPGGEQAPGAGQPQFPAGPPALA